MERPPVDEEPARRPQAGRVRDGAGRDDWARRLERLIPLIHDLLAWELVVRSESGTYVLADDVQQRLQETVARQARPGAQVYFGRPCQRCGATGVTRLIDGARLCYSCGRLSAAEASGGNASTPPTNGNGATPAGNGNEGAASHGGEPKRHPARDGHSWWYRKVG